MKKFVLLGLFIAALGGILFAQTATPTITITGTLGLSNGRIAVKSEAITYYVRELGHDIGFIDGAQVTLQGYASAPSLEGQTERLFFPTTFTLNGKMYEVGTTAGSYGGLEHPLASGRTVRGVSRRF
ncbi:MAG: hypothetical protein LBG24_02230 [Treponema sp.]|jgi:hypothetical protein|nr:hypothetical protein [Treponema sp.]